jgi:CheY-like chemotaxis protein
MAKAVHSISPYREKAEKLAQELTKLILIVEDSDEDFEAICRIMRQASMAHPIFRCSDGEEALDYLYHQGNYTPQNAPKPAIIILDLNLPGTDGREVLAEIKHDERLKLIPVIAWTTSSNPRDVEVCYRDGVNAYILKPIDITTLVKTVQSFMSFWLEIALLPNWGE